MDHEKNRFGPSDDGGEKLFWVIMILAGVVLLVSI
jgi:hypothetical protein